MSQDQIYVALRLTLEAAAGLDAARVSVNRSRAAFKGVSRPPGVRWIGTLKSQANGLPFISQRIALAVRSRAVAGGYTMVCSIAVAGWM